MILAVADTHAVLWYLTKDKRLSTQANNTMDGAAQTNHQIAISSISLIEVIYLVEKGKVNSSDYTALIAALGAAQPLFVEIPVALPVATALTLVSAKQVPDMPDRIIAATAVMLAVPLISRDAKIRLSTVNTIW